MEITQHQALFIRLYKEAIPIGTRDRSKKVYQLADYNTVKQLPEADRFEFLLYCLTEVGDYYRQLPRFDTQLQATNYRYVSFTKTIRKDFATEVAEQLGRSRFSLREQDLEQILDVYEALLHDMVHRLNMTETYAYNELLYNLPTAFLFRQLKIIVNENGVSDKLRKRLLASLFNREPENTYTYGNKIVDAIKSLLNSISDPQGLKTGSLPIILDESDTFGQAINLSVQEVSSAQRTMLFRLLDQSKKASGSKPSQKYLRDTQSLISELGGSAIYLSLVKNWLGSFSKVAIQRLPHTYTYGDQEHTYTSLFFMSAANALVAKGLVWSLIGMVEQNLSLLPLLGDVAEKSYQKLPGLRPAAVGVGNACLYVLAQSGLAGIGQLSRLKLRIRQPSTQALIQKYIQDESVRMGISPQLIEDMAVVDHGLSNGKLSRVLGDYRADVTITGIGKVDLRWFKADGSPLKSEPTAVKKEFSAELKALKSTVADIAKNTTAQRNRVDRSMLLDRQWTWQEFTDYYVNHGLMSFLAHRLIWTVEKHGQKATVFYQHERWADHNGVVIDWLDADVTVQLWHPVGQPVESVLAWREFLISREIRQPMKQAFREVYLLTDAELNTRLYSNRMAAHILRQHQFSTLAKGRGWRCNLLGAYDKDYDSERAQLLLPTYDLKAEFWVSEVNADNAWNDTGIYLYVATDQVRFTHLNDHEPLPLIDIPPLVFSEVMRDVDLFVGVGSVGNDPNWRDGGLTQFRTYWESYSFGELGELAKSRRQAVERLLPRLKIAHVATIRDKFLVVEGKLRTYKIHLGSGNILMEPNDQYLCIVPDRGVDKVATSVFLPFEGDSVLSIVLSKAFLLADDDKITDPTIVQQIGR